MFQRRRLALSYGEALLLLLALGVLLQLSGYFLLPKESHVRTWFYLTVLAPWALLLPLEAHSLPVRHPLFLLAFLVPFYLGLTSVWAPGSNAEAIADYLTQALSVFAFISAVGIALTRFPGLAELGLRVFVVAGVVSASAAIVQYLALNGLHVLEGEWPRAGGYGILLRREIRAGVAYAAVALVAVGLFIHGTRRPQSAFWLIAALPPLAAAALTQSRGPLLSLALGVVGLVAIRPGHRWNRRTLYVLSAMLVALVCVASLPVLREWVMERGLSFRDEIWMTVWNEAMEHPCLGRGLSDDMAVTVTSGLTFKHAHNFLLSVFDFSGALGVVLVAIQLALTVHHGLRHADWTTRIWALLLVYGCLSLLTIGKHPLSKPTDTWLVYWIPIAFVYAAVTRRAAEQAAPTAVRALRASCGDQGGQAE